ncbi:MFS transporter [Flindersiella endophytica]
MSTITAELRQARFCVSMTFLLHAAVFATWTPRIPAIKEGLRLGNDDLGFALGGMAVGLLIGTRLTGRMERRGRTAVAMRIIMPLQAIALIGPAFAWNLSSLTAALFVLGLLGGMLDVAMNAHAVAVERLYGRPIMSAFHGLWSLGSMGAAAVAAGVAKAGVDYHPHFVVAALVCALASLPLQSRLLSGDRESAAIGHGTEASSSSRRTVGLLVVLLLVVMGFGAFMSEGAIADWGAVFLRDERGATQYVAALGISVFAGAMALSRLVADRIGERLGPVLMARLGAGMAMLGYVVFLLAPSPWVSIAGFALAGIGIGPVVPVVFSAGGNTRTAKRPSLLGITVTAGYTGSVLGPVFIGNFGEWFGLPWGLAVPIVFLLLVVLAAGLLSGAAGGKGAESAEVAAHAHGPANTDG